LRVVLDTNIYLAALREGGFVFRMFREIFSPDFNYIVFISPDIKDEIEEKLQIWVNEKLADHRTVTNLRIIIDEYIHQVIPKETLQVIKDDPDDDKILECALAAGANLIVSMDKHLLRLRQFRNIPIVHPSSFSFMFPQK